MSICPSRRLTVALLLTCWLAGCQKTPPTPRQQAKAALDRGDWAAAAELCSELLPDLPEDRELLRIRAQSYLGLRQTSEAIEDYSLLIRLEPENPDYYYLRQIAYQRAGQPELAEADGNQGRRLDPLYPTAYLYDMRNFIPSSLPDDNESGDEERSSEATGQQAAETTAATDRLAGQAEDGDEWAEEAPTQSGRPADATEASEAAGPADTDGQAVAEDASLDGGLLRKWLSEKRRQGEATPLELPDEPSPLEVPYVPPKLTTALPDSSASPGTAGGCDDPVALGSPHDGPARHDATSADRVDPKHWPAVDGHPVIAANVDWRHGPARESDGAHLIRIPAREVPRTPQLSAGDDATIDNQHPRYGGANCVQRPQQGREHPTATRANGPTACRA